MNKKTKEHYIKLRAHARFTKTIAITPEVYEWVEGNRGKKSRAQFLDDEIKEHRKPSLFNKQK